MIGKLIIAKKERKTMPSSSCQVEMNCLWSA